MVREGVNLHGDSAANLDVHHHLPPWILSTALQTETVIANSKRTLLPILQNTRLACPEHCLVIAALHIVNDRWKGKAGLRSWRDMLVVSEAIGRDATRRAFFDAHLLWLLQLVSSALLPHAPNSVLAGFTDQDLVPPQMALRLRAMAWGNLTWFSRQRIAWAARLPNPNASLFLLGTAVPSRAYVKHNDGSYPKYWFRGIHEVLATFRGGDFRSPLESDRFDGD
jgi:hypothetical protein